MRDILFRGKAVKSGEWHYGMFVDECYDADFPCILPHDDAGIDITDFHVDRKTVGQFTGLCDKNGTKIFEGDILEFHFDDAYPEDATLEEVIFANFAWCIKQPGFDPEPIEDNDLPMEGIVIGNVYDNPELLKGGAE